MSFRQFARVISQDAVRIKGMDGTGNLGNLRISWAGREIFFSESRL